MRFAGHGLGCPPKEYKYRPPSCRSMICSPSKPCGFGRKRALTPRTQKVTSTAVDIIRHLRVLRTAPSRRSGWHGNAVADDDRVVVDEHLFDDQADDALPLDEVECFGGYPQPRQKRRER